MHGEWPLPGAYRTLKTLESRIERAAVGQHRTIAPPESMRAAAAFMTTDVRHFIYNGN